MHASGDYSLGNAFSRAFELFKTRYGLVLGISMLTLAVNALPSILLTPISFMAVKSAQNSQASMMLPLLQMGGQCFQLLWTLLVATPLSIGGLWVLVRMLRGDPDACFADITTPFRRLGWLVVTQLLLSAVLIAAVFVAVFILLIISFIIGLIGGITFGSEQRVVAMVGIAAAVLGVPLIITLVYYPMVRVSGMLLLVVDDTHGQLGPAEALSRSWNGTRGHGWSLVLLFILTSLLVPATLLLFCIGVPLVGIPMYVSIFAAAYTLLFSDRSEPAAHERSDAPQIK